LFFKNANPEQFNKYWFSLLHCFIILVIYITELPFVKGLTLFQRIQNSEIPIANVRYTFQAYVEMTTAWALTKGPCGPSCNTGSVNESTLNTRTLMEQQNPDYFGKFQVLLKKQDLSAQITPQLTEHVLAVSKSEQWEQELCTFKLPINDSFHDVRYVHIYFILLKNQFKVIVLNLH